MVDAGERTFFVESYVPRLDEAAALALSSRLRAAVEEFGQDGVPLYWRGSFALADQETYVWLLAAPELDRVAQVSERAGVGYYDVTEVVGLDPSRLREAVAPPGVTAVESEIAVTP